MKKYGLAILGLVGFAAITVHAEDESTCERLMQLHPKDTRITLAQSIVPAPTWEAPTSLFSALAGGHVLVSVPLCRVTAVIEHEIGIEVWLPQNWNGRFEGVGNGGLTGAINYPSMATALSAGFATASTDTGHITDKDVFQSDWIAGHRQRVIDFTYRAHHLLAERAKDIITAFYSRPPKHNYFSGCSSGGWEGLTEAQRYPTDYDGIIAGAPAINYVGATTRGMVLQQWAAKNPQGNLDGAVSRIMEQAAVARCDAQDGLEDGLVSDPLSCHFDPAELACKAGQTSGCLNPDQIERARRTFGPLRSPGGLKLYPGPTWGSPAFFGLPGTRRPAPASAPPENPLIAMAEALTGSKVSWTPETFDPDRDLVPLSKAVGADINSMNPDLKAFQARGGKLILYHGGADPGLSPYNTIDYLESVEQRLGKSRVASFVRLYLVPGMGHCGGGTGPNVFDSMTPLEHWTEHGDAPREIVASRPATGSAAARSRPLCPYPQLAHYRGAGSIDEAVNFECKSP